VKTTKSPQIERALNPFLQKHAADVMGILHGFDRIRLQGTLRCLYRVEVFQEYLTQAKVLLKDFKSFVTRLTSDIRQRAEALAQASGRPFQHLKSCNINKEDLARDIAQRDGVREGLIAVFNCVEGCRTFRVYGNQQSRKLELRLEWGKCSHLYFYLQHPRLGFLHVRVQTWFPFLIQICLNGHEWLARQMTQAGLRHHRLGNRFTWIEDMPRAQKLMEEQLRTNWEGLCEQLRRTYHPLHARIAAPLRGLSYYWTAPETEYSSDVLFRNAAVLDRLMPRLMRHAIQGLGAEQVMRFLGKRCDAGFEGEQLSDLRRRQEGVRIKHWVNRNSIKLYNCQNVLRPETTINDPQDLRVFRTSPTHPDGPGSWMPMRRSVADLHRRAQLSRAANERYLAALATANDSKVLAEDTLPLCQSIRRDGRRYRALNPFNPDEAAWLKLIRRGEWCLKGFRNRDLRHLIFGPTSDLHARRRQAAQVTRRLALYHAHGLITKVPRTHRWMLTPKGRRLITALMAAHSATTDQLISLAA
jgi:hypothetical protein